MEGGILRFHLLQHSVTLCMGMGGGGEASGGSATRKGGDWPDQRSQDARTTAEQLFPSPGAGEQEPRLAPSELASSTLFDLFENRPSSSSLKLLKFLPSTAVLQSPSNKHTRPARIRLHCRSPPRVLSVTVLVGISPLTRSFTAVHMTVHSSLVSSQMSQSRIREILDK